MNEQVGGIARAVLPTVTYKPGWRFKLGGPLNGFVCIYATTPDSWHPQRSRCTQHQFAIPDHIDTRQAFTRWLFDCLLLCEQHEVGEFLTVAGHRPFYPHHQDEGSPYELVERWETP